MQAAQWRLLDLLRREAPAALYPAALCALADLLEVEAQDALDEALAAGDTGAVDRLLAPAPDDACALFESAVAGAGGGGGGDAEGAAGNSAAAAAPEQRQRQQQWPTTQAGVASGQEQGAAAPAVPTATKGGGTAEAAADDPGWLWYPHSYLAGFLFRRAEFLARAAEALPEALPRLSDAAEAALRAALAAAAAGGGVLARYRLAPVADEQLLKDVEGGLEYCGGGLVALHRRAGGLLADASLLEPLLRLFDGCCALFEGRPKPGAWVKLLLQAAKLFTPEARGTAAAGLQPRSGPMRAAQPLWEGLKPAQLRPLFEMSDVGEGGGCGEAAAAGGRADGRAAKRQRA